LNTITLLDTGPLVAFLNRRDHFHFWVTDELQKLEGTLVTCEAVLSEALYLTRSSAAALRAIAGMVGEGIIRVAPVISEQGTDVFRIMSKYADLPASLADAGLLSLYMDAGGDRILTLDSDFSIYRDHNNKPLKLIAPWTTEK
jgi:uncharacterized protein